MGKTKIDESMKVSKLRRSQSMGGRMKIMSKKQLTFGKGPLLHTNQRMISRENKKFI